MIFLNLTATTPCLKKIPAFKLYVTLSNLNPFSKFLHCRKAYDMCYKTHTALPISPYNNNNNNNNNNNPVCNPPCASITHPEARKRMLLHYLKKLKIQMFRRCGRKRKQIAFFIVFNFVIHPQILIFLACHCAFICLLS